MQERAEASVRARDLGSLLRRYREVRGLHQEELAALVEPSLSVNTISNVERGRTRPHQHTVEGLATALDLTAEQREELTAAWRAFRAEPAGAIRSMPGVLHALPRGVPQALGNLPRSPTPLIGRAAELETITTQLRSQQIQLLTLTGVGGIGKSRLALAAAETLVDAFADGVWFVPLAPVATSSQVVSAIAGALELPDAGGHLLQNVREFLKRRHLLLVLDNFEHLLPAATLVAEFMSEAASLKILVTSREVLHLSTEHTLEVPPLGFMPRFQAPSGLDGLLQSDAVRLFFERARDVKPDFSVTEDSALMVAEICRRLDGLPLAIELAAARLKHAGLDQLLLLLERRLLVLTGGPRDLPARQQTLRGAIKWSYDLLQPAEQAVFRRLAVFTGSCTLEAAQSVCVRTAAPLRPDTIMSSIDVLDQLGSLIDKSLLRFDDGARYAMLETVREFALEQLVAAGEESAVRARHASYFEELVQRSAPRFLGAEQLSWLARIDDDIDNVRAVLAWLLQTSEYERGQRLTGSLWFFWSVHCRVTEGREWVTRFLDGPIAQSMSPLARASAYIALTFITTRQDDADVNYEASARSVGLAREAGDPWMLGMALARLAFVAERMDTRTIAAANAPVIARVDVAEAYEEALAIFRRLGDEWATAQCLHSYGRFLSARDAARARAMAFEAATIARRIGERHALGMALATLANLDLDVHEREAARQQVEESLAIAEELNDLFNSSQRLGTLAQIEMDEMHFANAARLLERCLANLRLVGNQHRLANVLHDVACAARLAGDADRAREAFEDSHSVFYELGLHAEVAAVMASFGHLERQVDTLQSAAATFESSWHILSRQGSDLGVPTVLAGLGELALDRGQVARAACLLGAAEALIERLQTGPTGVLNRTRPSMRAHQLRRDETHVRELRRSGKSAFAAMPAGAFRAAFDAGGALSTSQACTLGLEL